MSDCLLQRERHVSLGEDWSQTESGLYIPQAEAPKDPPTAVDLFAGAGGFSLGFHMAGFHVVGALEWDFWASLTYLVNLGSPDTELIFATGDDKERWEKALAAAKRPARKDQGEKVNADAAVDRERWGSGWRNASIADRYAPEPDDEDDDDDSSRWCLEPCEVFVFGDARKVSGADFLAWLGMEQDELAVIMGGPPCQGFSRAGKRQVMDPRNSLVFDFMRIVTEMRPQAFVMENVPGIVDMVTPEGLNVVDALCRIAQDGGFGNYDAIKRSLVNTATAGMGALAGKPESVFKSRRKPKEKPKKDDGQGSLLEDAS